MLIFDANKPKLNYTLHWIIIRQKWKVFDRNTSFMIFM